MKRFLLWVLCAFYTLLITSSSLSAATMSSQQRTGYNLTNYPSYDGSGRINGTVFPLTWYSHHYFGFHRSTSHPYTFIYSGYPGHHSQTLLEHQNSLAHYILHHGSGLSHSTQHSLGHTVGHSAGRSGGHNIGHTIGHSVGHTSGHAVGHTGSRHPGGHRGGHSHRH